MRVIAYASRGLHNSERNANNYSSKKLELLALKWAVVDKFCDYLLGSKFQVYTDNNPMVYLVTKSKLPAIEQNWASDLVGFDFTIHYRPGKTNGHADTLSHQKIRPWDVEATEICASAAQSTSLFPEIQRQAWQHVKTDHVFNGYIDEVQVKQATRLPSISIEQFRTLQINDEDISRFRMFWKHQQVPDLRVRKAEPKPVQLLLRQWPRLFERQQILYRRIQDPAHG